MFIKRKSKSNPELNCQNFFFNSTLKSTKMKFLISVFCTLNPQFFLEMKLESTFGDRVNKTKRLNCRRNTSIYCVDPFEQKNNLFYLIVIYETILEARKEAYERDIFLNSEHNLKDILIS